MKAVAFDAQTVFGFNRCQAPTVMGNSAICVYSALARLNVKQFGVQTVATGMRPGLRRVTLNA